MFKKMTSLLLVVIMVTLSLSVIQESNAATEMNPVTLKNVTYKFNDNVKFLDLSSITKVGENLRLPNATVLEGDILVDQTHQLSLKVLKVNADGTFVTTKPTMIELFKEFNIPRQVIQPNAANITEYAVKGISVADYLAKNKTPSASDTGGQKVMSGTLPTLMDEIHTIFINRGSKVYEYNGEYEFSSFGGFNSTKVKLSLDGALGISPGIVADYSIFDGYEFGFADAAQFIDVNMMFNVKLKEEVYLPIYGITVPIAGLGNVRVGVFLVVDVNGDITLTVRAEEGIVANAYIHGDTNFGVPTSFHSTSSFDKYFAAECDPMGYIQAGLYITPLVSLEILDVDVFDAQLRLGFYGYANITDQTMNYGVDFVINAFVTILDDRNNLINEHIPIIERNKTFRQEDDVIFYFSRLCAYQDRINVAAMTRRKTGVDVPNAPPFSDKLPFANRQLEVWYYKSGNNPTLGTNVNPDFIIYVNTDDRGCVGIDFTQVKAYKYNTLNQIVPQYQNGIDVQKGDMAQVRASGFVGKTDLLKSVSPFGLDKQPGQSDFYGSSKLPGDFFEDKVVFRTLSGWDLTGLDVPNSEGVEFEPKKRIYYEGPVTLYSTDKNTGITEKATFKVNSVDRVYTPLKTGIYSSMIGTNTYNIKPFNEMRWQINADGFIYGTYEPTGQGGPETHHQITVKRLVEDKQVLLEDQSGKNIGIQHNVALRLIAVNKGGDKVYQGTGNLHYILGKVPFDYVPTHEKDFDLVDIGYLKFPAANVRYPNHYEYYTFPPFPVILYEKNDGPSLVLDPSNNIAFGAKDTIEGAVSEAHYYWRWEERKPDIPETVTVKRRITSTSATGAPVSRTVTSEVSNIVPFIPLRINLSAFDNVPVSYIDYNPLAGNSVLTDEVPVDVYQTRHLVTGLTVEGVKIEDPSLSPPQPVEKGSAWEDLTPGDPRKFDIEFQFELMKNHSDRFVVSPIDMSAQEYRSMPAVFKDNSIQKMPIIKNAAALPQWARGYITSAVNNNIMSLDSTGNFPIGKYTTRAEFSSAIVNALGLSQADTLKTGFTFKDIKAADKNFEGIKIAYQCGIINGTTDTTFSPTALITRQDAAAMLMRAFNLKNTELIPPDSAGKINTFTDSKAVSSYSITSLNQAISLDFFGGYPNGTLMPRNNIMNEQTAKILWELKLKAEKPGKKWSL